MSDLHDEELIRARGSLDKQFLGARGLGRIVNNPSCQRLRVLSVLGVSPDHAATQVYGFPPKEQLSPFAAEAGRFFEDAILRDQAEWLVQALRNSQYPLPQPPSILHIDRATDPAGEDDRAYRRQLTEDCIVRRASGKRDAPDLIVKPRIRISLLGTDHEIEPDALIARSGSRHYLVAEIKGYPDRGSKTATVDVRGPALQSAIGEVALRQMHTRLGLPERSGELVESVLVLRRPGYYWPSVHPLWIDGELSQVNRLLSEPGDSVVDCIRATPPIDNPAALDRIPYRYSEFCRFGCGLYRRCRGQAAEDDDLGQIGSSVRDDLRPAGTISRAIDLMHGRVPTSASMSEREIAEQLAEALSVWREGLGQ